MKRVEFICIGNCCRSQMAEGFARLYGSDVLVASSSGLAPTQTVAGETIACMREKDVDISLQFPKRFAPYAAKQLDLIVNMSGFELPAPKDSPLPPQQSWAVPDPFGLSEKAYRESRDLIERLVMQLILELRREVRLAEQNTPVSAG